MLVQRVLAGVIEEEAEEDQYSLESAGSAPVLRSQRTSRSHSTTSSDGLSFLRALPAAAVAEKPRDQKSTTTASTPCASDMDPCTTDDDDRRTFGAEWTTVAGKGRRRPAAAVREYEAAVSRFESKPRGAKAPSSESLASESLSPMARDVEASDASAKSCRFDLDDESAPATSAKDAPAPATSEPSAPATSEPAAADGPRELQIETAPTRSGQVSRANSARSSPFPSPSSTLRRWAQGAWDPRDLARGADFLAAIRSSCPGAKLAALAKNPELSDVVREQVLDAAALLSDIERCRNALWARLQTRQGAATLHAANLAQVSLRKLPQAGDDDWFPHVAAALRASVPARLLRSLVEMAQKACKRHDVGEYWD